MSDAYENALMPAVAGLGQEVSVAQIDLLRRHMEFVLDANQRFNLTRITDPAKFAVEMHADSLAVAAWANQTPMKNEPRLLDIGSGAGVPAIPLAIARPDWRVTAIDAREKKARFIADAGRSLGLDNLTVLQAHSEHWHGERPFDLVTFKAVGKLTECLRLALPLTGEGSRVLVFKTETAPGDEIAVATSFAKESGFAIEPSFRYTLAFEGSPALRVLFVFRRR